MDFTPLSRLYFAPRARRRHGWTGREREVQLQELLRLLHRGADTEFGRIHGFAHILRSNNPEEAYRDNVPMQDYEDIRPQVMRMVEGAKDVLWPGVCLNYAQSSGTTGGRSKYIPVTPESLRRNHYAGAADTVAFYLAANPESRLFSGKGLILGGSFASMLKPSDPRVRVGDLSATLIDKTPGMASLFRIPDKKTALMADWSEKLDALASASAGYNVTNLSGVPSWFMRVLLRILEREGASNIREVWPNLEVFFHGGISFEPYRDEYRRICGAEALTDGVGHEGMHYFETYNASEGFFAVQHGPGPGRRPMLMLLDVGVWFEFLRPGAEEAVGVDGVEAGKVYELIISSCNGLWRYRLGDTVKIESVSPLLITMAGRTKSFINAFGEELMECNAEAAISEAAEATGARVADYTVAPVYARGEKRGRHQWIIEWQRAPGNIEAFTERLDAALRRVNSDYDAKRSGTIFLDPPLITEVAAGTFDRWLQVSGSGKLGGQRKVPRLSNDRTIADTILSKQ